MKLDSPTRDQKDEIELLALIIEAYERRTTTIAPPSPVEGIKFRMDRFGFPEAATALRIAELAMEANVHPSVVAGRVRFETRNYRRFGRLVGNGEVRKIFPREGVYAGARG